MTKLAIAAAAAGTICTLGAASAFAAPSAGWSGAKGPVPGAITNSTPTISSITFPGRIGQGTIVGWKSRGNSGDVFFKYRAARLDKGKWSKKFTLAGADAGSGPVFRPYRDPSGHDAILAVWTGHLDHHIWFEQGRTLGNGKITWTKATVLPSKVQFTNTTNAPSVLFTNHVFRVVLTWRGPANHVRLAVGVPSGRGFNWSNSTIVPGPAVTSNCKGAPCTANTPAIAEQQVNATTGTIYFFWRQLSSDNIMYSTTADTAVNLAKPAFSGPTQVTGAVTNEGPAASDSTLSGFGPLLLAYKAPGSDLVRYQTFSSSWSAPAVVPTTHTTVSPSLFINVLGTTTPGLDGNIIWHVFSS
ncbi:MAG TPA: hypothetical protein VIZ43_15085 [Trebonia sp.]